MARRKLVAPGAVAEQEPGAVRHTPPVRRASMIQLQDLEVLLLLT